jgi:hypothetical protein
MSKFPLIFLVLFVNFFLYNCQKVSPKISFTPTTPVVSFSPNTNFTNQNQTQTQINYGDSQCLVVGNYYISYIIEKNSKKKNKSLTDREGGLVTVIPTICPFYNTKTGYNGYASIALHQKEGIDSASFIVIAW